MAVPVPDHAYLERSGDGLAAEFQSEGIGGRSQFIPEYLREFQVVAKQGSPGCQEVFPIEPEPDVRLRGENETGVGTASPDRSEIRNLGVVLPAAHQAARRQPVHRVDGVRSSVGKSEIQVRDEGEAAESHGAGEG